jgi:hypothetical protein
MATDTEKRYRAAVLADTPLLASHYASKMRRESSPRTPSRSTAQSGQGLLGGIGSGIGNMIGGLLGGRAKMVGDVVKGVGRDLGMGFGILERDQDFYDRTRETLRRQYGDERAELYDRQMAARRAAAPSASSGSGSSMSTTLRPMVRPFDLPLSNMGFIGANNREEAIANVAARKAAYDAAYPDDLGYDTSFGMEKLLVEGSRGLGDITDHLGRFSDSMQNRMYSKLLPPMETPPSTDKREILESYNRLMETIPEGTSELVRQQYEDYILKSGGRKPFTEIFPE